MGRTNPTYRDRLDGLEREWRSYRRALRATRQEQFDRLFEHGREYAHAAGHLNHPNPEIPFLLSTLLAHERRIAQLESQLRELTDDEDEQQRPETPSEEGDRGVHD